jgi:uncharacterized 2Fe-2S/4Fe-4S cluster protein (DUF4445 family)
MPALPPDRPMGEPHSRGGAGRKGPMEHDQVSVKFEPQGKVVSVPRGAAMREAAARAGILLDYPCGGQGNCGKCRIRIMGTPPPPTPAEELALAPELLADGMRLACQSTVTGPTTVEVPDTSLVASSYQILGSAGGDLRESVDPPVWKRFVELPRPTLQDDVPDAQRLQRVLGDVRIDPAFLRELPERLRQCDFQGTAVILEDRIIDFEAGDTESACYGAVFDVGTTTLVGVLLDLATGKECATASRINPQTSYGDDVLSRILFGRESAENLARIQGEILEALRGLIRDLAAQAGIDPRHIYEATFAGNTTMETLLLGHQPRPAWANRPSCRPGATEFTVPAAELGLGIHPPRAGVRLPRHRRVRGRRHRGGHSGHRPR